LVAKYSDALHLLSLNPKKTLVTENGATTKILFTRLSDNLQFESVLMRHDDGRNTVCVSCMVGCPVNCAFCATGKLGFKANLTYEEIVDQVIYFAHILKAENLVVSNVVYMGMGEPMLNLESVVRSVTILTDPNKVGLSPRRITISTAGYAPQIIKLTDMNYAGNMAISLHAPNQELREKLMPVAKNYKLPELMKSIDYYVSKTNRRVSYEYILIDGLNDTEQHAKELAELLRGRLVHVNLIPYNPVSSLKFQKSSRNRVYKFLHFLEDKGVNATIRVTMGDDTNAACGQLASNN